VRELPCSTEPDPTVPQEWRTATTWRLHDGLVGESGSKVGVRILLRAFSSPIFRTSVKAFAAISRRASCAGRVLGRVELDQFPGLYLPARRSFKAHSHEQQRDRTLPPLVTGNRDAPFVVLLVTRLLAVPRCVPMASKNLRFPGSHPGLGTDRYGHHFVVVLRDRNHHLAFIQLTIEDHDFLARRAQRPGGGALRVIAPVVGLLGRPELGVPLISVPKSGGSRRAFSRRFWGGALHEIDFTGCSVRRSARIPRFASCPSGTCSQ
jgi:hypothetical protein